MIRKIICYTVLLSDSGCKNKNVMLCYVMLLTGCSWNLRNFGNPFKMSVILCALGKLIQHDVVIVGGIRKV